MKKRIAMVALGMVLQLCACSSGNGGGNTASGGQGGDAGAGASGGAAGSGGAGGSSGMTVCPGAEPMQGTACSVQGLYCSYGDSPFPMCRHRYRCDMGQWATFRAFCQDEPPACAPSPPDGTACPGQTSYCVDGSRLCMCPVCGGAGCPPEPWSWSCSNAPAAGCPDFVPNEGTECTDTALVCEYGIMCNEYARVQCINGVWAWDPFVACP